MAQPERRKATAYRSALAEDRSAALTVHHRLRSRQPPACWRSVVRMFHKPPVPSMPRSGHIPQHCLADLTGRRTGRRGAHPHCEMEVTGADGAPLLRALYTLIGSDERILMTILRYRALARSITIASHCADAAHPAISGRYLSATPSSSTAGQRRPRGGLADRRPPGADPWSAAQGAPANGPTSLVGSTSALHGR